MALSDQLAAAEATAVRAEDKLTSLISTANTVAQGYSTVGDGITVTAPTIANIPFDPTIHLGNTFLSDYNSEWTGMETWVRGLMGDYLNTHFPILNPALGIAEDSWLLNVINNGYAGIPAAIETAIWNRARSRDAEEALRLETEAVESWAARGFMLPPGMLIHRVQQVQQEVANKASVTAREIAIKQVDISIDMIKTAISQVSQLRTGMASALADFIRAFTSLPDSAARIAEAKAKMQQVVWESSSSYLRTQADIARLSLDAQKANAGTNLSLQKMSIDASEGSINRQVEAALTSASKLGEVAAAARAAQNTLVGEITNRTE